MLGIVQDITHQKETEKALQDAYAEMEKRVEARTSDLAAANRELQTEIFERKQVQEKLIYAKKQAEQANMTKSQFLANISHELRTPMHGILSFSKFGIDWIDTADQDKLLHYFNQIHNSGERLLALLNDLLDLSKLESGKMEYQMTEKDLRMIVGACITEFSLTAHEKKVSLKANEPDFLTRIHCDETRIDQVMRNLMSNAIKFSPDRGTVTVSYEATVIPMGRRSTDQTHIKAVAVKVKDQGIGIPEEELKKVFDKFVQSSKTRTGAGGTGLGLAICAEIIRAHQGKIWAENNPEGGATFTFTLPYEQTY